MANVFKQALDASLRFLRITVPPSVRAGRPATSIFGGFIQQIEKNRKLAGLEKYRTFSEILANVSIVAGSVRYFLNLLGRAGWKVVPKDADDPASVEIAERIERALFEELATPFVRVVRRAAMARYYGFSWQEWTARRAEDGTIIFDDVEPRAQITIEKWDRDFEDGKILGVVQRTDQDVRERYIPRSKSVYVVDDSLNDSPEGLGLFRHIVDSAERLLRYQQLEGFGYEKDLRGIPKAFAPIRELQRAVENDEISEEDAEQQIQDLKNFVQMSAREPQTGLLLDSITYQSEDEASRPSPIRQWDLELMSGSNYAVREVALTISRLQREIARTLGTESILLGETGAGSLAMSRDKSDQLAQVVDCTLQEIAEAFESDLVDPLMRLNGWPMELRPKLQPDKIQQRDVAEIAEALQRLAAAGAILEPGDPAVDEVRALLGLSPAPESVTLDPDLALGGDAPAGREGTSDEDLQGGDSGEETSEKLFTIEKGRAVPFEGELTRRKESRYAVVFENGSAQTLPQRSLDAAEAQAGIIEDAILAKKVGGWGGRSVYEHVRQVQDE